MKPYFWQNFWLGVLLASMVFAVLCEQWSLRDDMAPSVPAKISVEEARFMLECTQDWGLTGDECRAVLHGENPPTYDGCEC